MGAKVEVYAEPATSAQAVVDLVRDLMVRLRRVGYRVVTSCDFEDKLPQQDWEAIEARRRARRT